MASPKTSFAGVGSLAKDLDARLSRRNMRPNRTFLTDASKALGTMKSRFVTIDPKPRLPVSRPPKAGTEA
jgi:hypothetical protein